MYYILYEGLKIESNEPVYCTNKLLTSHFCVDCTLERPLDDSPENTDT